MASGESLECRPLTDDCIFNLKLPHEACAVSVSLLPGGRWLYGSAIDPNKQRLVLMCWDLEALKLLASNPHVPRLEPVAKISGLHLLDPVDIDALEEESEFGSWQYQTFCYQYDPESQTVNHLIATPLWSEDETDSDAYWDERGDKNTRPSSYGLEIVQLTWTTTGKPRFRRRASYELSEQLPEDATLEGLPDAWIDLQGDLAFFSLKNGDMIIWRWKDGLHGRSAAALVFGRTQYQYSRELLTEYTFRSNFSNMVPLTTAPTSSLEVFTLHVGVDSPWDTELQSSSTIDERRHLPRDHSPLGLIALKDDDTALIPWSVYGSNGGFRNILMTSSSRSRSIRHQFWERPSQIFFCTAQHLLAYSDKDYSISIEVELDFDGWSCPMYLPLMDSAPRQREGDSDREIFLNVPLSADCSLVDAEERYIHIHNICPISGSVLAESDVNYAPGHPGDRLFVLAKLAP
ncbi:hypothetical protein DL93DRAFT_2173012 [Clavulina sp. PMI_390]|nr:hypothetical protein DL93DRAFT_2173012 [Clavulina sp. PMI_390]